MRIAPREGASDGNNDPPRAGPDSGAGGGALVAARRAAADRGCRSARLERAALLGKRRKLVAVWGTAARARPLDTRLPCRTEGRCCHLQRVPHLRYARGGGALGMVLASPMAVALALIL